MKAILGIHGIGSIGVTIHRFGARCAFDIIDIASAILDPREDTIRRGHRQIGVGIRNIVTINISKRTLSCAWIDQDSDLILRIDQAGPILIHGRDRLWECCQWCRDGQIGIARD
jgi:hypothetical protein